MAQEKLPKLTEADVQGLAAGKSFQRGKDYYRHGALISPTLEGNTLRAECEGSEYEPYEVSATLSAKGVADVDCTCPYDWGGICKHQVALLLTYVHKPQAFSVLQPLDKLLAQRSREELIAIIQQMLEQQPKLRSVLELATATKSALKGRAVDTEAHRRQAQRLMQSESEREIERGLAALGKTAEAFARAGDHLNAGAIYQVVLEEGADGYDDMMSQVDEDGGVASALDDIALGLAECLKAVPPPHPARQGWLTTLLKTRFTDIHLGGMDFAGSASDIVLEHATPDEWPALETIIRAEIPRHKSQYSNWGQETLVGLIAQWHEKHGNKQEAAALIRELGSPEQKTYLLIEEGKTEAALREIQKIIPGKPGLATQFADALVTANAHAQAVALIRAQTGWTAKEWFAKYYRAHGTPQEALGAQCEWLLFSPSLEKYKELEQLAQNAGAWKEVRAGVLHELAAKPSNIGTRLEIALYENNVRQALDLVPQAKDSYSDYRVQVAQAAETDFPREAIALYQERADLFILRRNRDNYARAAESLKRAHALYEKLNALEEWKTYIKNLRAQYNKLSALQDELTKAGL